MSDQTNGGATGIRARISDRQTLMQAAGFWEQPGGMVGAAAVGQEHSRDDLDAVIAIEASSEPQQALSMAAEKLASIGLVQYYTFRARHSADQTSLKLTAHHPQ